MKKKLIYITILSFFVINSCSVFNSQKQKYFEFSKEIKNIKIVEFDIIEKITLNNDTMSNMQIVEDDSSMFFIALKRGTNKVLKYNLLNKEKKVIDFSKTIKNKFSNYYDYQSPSNLRYINKDSIFLLYSRHYNGNHDSIFLLCDENKEIKNIYSLNATYVQNLANPQNANSDDAVIWMPNIFHNPVFWKDKLFIHFVSNADYLGDEIYRNLPIAGYIDTRNNQFRSININYPAVEYEKTFYADFNKYFFSTLANDNSILYGFKYTPELIKYNFKTKHKQNVSIKSTIYDTVYVAKSEKGIVKGLEYDMPFPNYFALQYDQYRKYYYRFVSMPKHYGKANYTLVVADTNFNVVAEGFPPLKKSPLFFITKNHLITFDAFNQKDNQNGIFNLYVCDMKFRDGTNQELINKIKNNRSKKRKNKKPLSDYLKNYGKIKSANYIATIISQDATCENTLDFVLSHYQKNIEKYSQYDVYLFIETSNSKQLKNMLTEKYNLSPEKYSNIIIDTASQYSQHVDYKLSSLPRIIKIRKDKIVADTIFSTDDIGIFEMQNFLINSGKEQKKIKEKL